MIRTPSPVNTTTTHLHKYKKMHHQRGSLSVKQLIREITKLANKQLIIHVKTDMKQKFLQTHYHNHNTADRV